MVAFVVASLLEGFRCLASSLILSVCQSRFYSSLLMRHEKSLLFYIYILLLFNKLPCFIWNLEYSLNVRQINDRKEKYGVLLEYQR